jgi:hypothetical protein
VRIDGGRAASLKVRIDEGRAAKIERAQRGAFAKTQRGFFKFAASFLRKK